MVLLSMTVLYIFPLGLLTIGNGAIRSCNLPFGVVQLDQTDKRNRTGLYSYYDWYYSTSTAALGTRICHTHIQTNISWCQTYVHVPPEGSIFSGIVELCATILKEKTQVSMPS
jgi:dipeptide/tripeptide permease